MTTTVNPQGITAADLEITASPEQTQAPAETCGNPFVVDPRMISREVGVDYEFGAKPA